MSDFNCSAQKYELSWNSSDRKVWVSWWNWHDKLIPKKWLFICCILKTLYSFGCMILLSTFFFYLETCNCFFSVQEEQLSLGVLHHWHEIPRVRRSFEWCQKRRLSFATNNQRELLMSSIRLEVSLCLSTSRRAPCTTLTSPASSKARSSSGSTCSPWTCRCQGGQKKSQSAWLITLQAPSGHLPAQADILGAPGDCVEHGWGGTHLDYVFTSWSSINCCGS